MNTKCVNCDTDASYIRDGNSYCFACNQSVRSELNTTYAIEDIAKVRPPTVIETLLLALIAAND